MRKMRISVNYADPHGHILSDAMNGCLKETVFDKSFSLSVVNNIYVHSKTMAFVPLCPKSDPYGLCSV